MPSAITVAAVLPATKLHYIGELRSVASKGPPPKSAAATQSRCLDPRRCATGVKVSDAEMARRNIQGDEFHLEWNYTEYG